MPFWQVSLPLRALNAFTHMRTCDPMLLKCRTWQALFSVVLSSCQMSQRICCGTGKGRSAANVSKAFLEEREAAIHGSPEELHEAGFLTCVLVVSLSPCTEQHLLHETLVSMNQQSLGCSFLPQPLSMAIHAGNLMIINIFLTERDCLSRYHGRYHSRTVIGTKAPAGKPHGGCKLHALRLVVCVSIISIWDPKVLKFDRHLPIRPEKLAGSQHA